MKKSAILTAIIAMGLVLSGCGGQTASHSKGQASSSSVSSTSQAAKQPAKSASAQATMKPYQVPKTDKQNSHYQRSGLLTLPGQFAYDKVGTKLTLSQNVATARSTASKGILYRVSGIKRMTNKARTKRALAMAEQAFNLQRLPNPYQTIQLKFTVKNQATKPVKIDGIQRVVINQSRQITTNSLSDPSAGTTLKPDQARTFYAMILTGPTSFKVNQLQVKFSGSFDDAGHRVAMAPKALSFKL